MSSKKRASVHNTTTSKTARKEVAIHPSQQALAQRFLATADTAKTGVIIVAPPGYGKTRAFRCISDNMDAAGGKHAFDLVVYVAKTPALARSQADEVGSQYTAPVTMTHVKGLAKALQKKGSNKSIRVCMTQAMFKTLLSKYNFCEDFAKPLGSPRIHIVLDEVHGWYIKSSPTFTALKFISSMLSMRVSGLTATAQLDGYGEKATRLFGSEAQTVEYTNEEETQFKHDLLSHCPASDPKWKAVPVKAPGADDGVERYLGPLATIVVGNVKTQGQGDTVRLPITAWIARSNLVAMAVAVQVHGDDSTGGLLLKKTGGKAPWRRFGEDESFVDKERAQAVLIVHRCPAGGELHYQGLKSLVGEEGVATFRMHDLRQPDIATHRENLEAFTQDVTKTDVMVLAMVDKRQIEGTNDYAKNVSAIVAVGAWTTAELTQLGGRLGRPCVFQPGDLVPQAVKLFHFHSKWASDVNQLGLVRQSIRANADKVPSALKARFEALDEEDQKKALQLIDGHKLLNPDLLATYLDSMEEGSTFLADYHKQVSKWCSATGQNGDSDEDDYEDEGE
jgi:hypothetical protein